MKKQYALLCVIYNGNWIVVYKFNRYDIRDGVALAEQQKWEYDKGVRPYKLQYGEQD